MANDYDIGAAFGAIEQELMSSMIRNMDHHRAQETSEGIQWSQWQAEQLKSLAKYKQQNRKKYGSQFKDINSQISSLIKAAKQEGGMNQEVQILNAIKDGFTGAKKASKGATAEFFRMNDYKLDALINATTNDMEKAETAILRKADDEYRKAIYNAQVYANTGAGTYEKAVDMATKDMLSRGLACVEYANGARHTLEDYADMAIRTASKRAYLMGEGEKRKEWGISTVIVNKRGNPCPKCLPFCGKVLIDDVWSGGKSSDGPYPLVSTAMAVGLYHPRCKDGHTTYFPGISTAEDTWTEAELERVEHANRKEYEQQYAGRQAARFGRLAKHSLDAENRIKYQAKATDWEQKMIKTPEYLPVSNWEVADIQTMASLQEELDLIPERHMGILEDSGVEIEFLLEGNSFYDPMSRKLFIAKGFEKYEIVHEMAHALEDVTGVWDDPKFLEVVGRISNDHMATDIQDDIETFVKPIRRIDDKRFVSEYQGRVYPDFGESTENGYVNPLALWDYLSEGYSCYIRDPKQLLAHDPKLYEYLEEWTNG